MRLVTPFEGEDYRKIKPHGLSIFVLGESSCDPDSQEELLSKDWNSRIMNSTRQGNPDPSITRAVELFYDKPLTFPIDHSTFLRAAAFANFVQHNLGRKKTRPTSDQWKAGKEPFEEYLIELQPQFVLALGKGVWDSLPTRYRKELPAIVLDGCLKPQPCFLYPNDNGYAFVFAIDHPSYWNRKRRTVSYYRPWVRAALEAARKFHYPELYTSANARRQENQVMSTKSCSGKFYWTTTLDSGKLVVVTRHPDGTTVMTYEVDKPAIPVIVEDDGKILESSLPCPFE